MERYNPFGGGSTSSIEDSRPFSTSFNTTNNNSEQPATPTRSIKELNTKPLSLSSSKEARQRSADPSQDTKKPDYTTSFPDPLGDVLLASEAAQAAKLAAERHEQQHKQHKTSSRVGRSSGSQNSGSIDDPVSVKQLAKQESSGKFSAIPTLQGRDAQSRASGGGTATSSSGGGAFSSFLSRATSVTSSSNISDRVSGAMGGMLNAVDSLSSSIQQVVPGNLNLNERLTSTASNLIGGGASNAPTAQTISRQRVIFIIDDITSTDWPAKFSQYNKFLSSQQQQQQHNQQHQNQQTQSQLDGGGQSSGSASGSMLTSFLNTSSSLLTYSTAPFTGSTLLSSSSAATQQANQQIASIEFGGDLIVQADYRDISILANQSTGLATVCILPNRQNNDNLNQLLLSSSTSNIDSNKRQQNQQLLLSSATSSSGRGSTCVSPGSVAASAQSTSTMQLNSIGQSPQLINYKTIRPEYVIVRQRARKFAGNDKDLAAGLLSQIVKAFDYCAIPMFEEPELWQIFQDRQLIFTRLLRIQRVLGREQFPLIPQVFCQTHHDLINYVQSSSANIRFPCNVYLGNSNTICNNFLVDGKLRVDSLEMLRQFASIMVSSGLTCTIEPFLDIKCEFVIQRIGSNLKLYKKSLQQQQQQLGSPNYAQQTPSSLLRNNRSMFAGGSGDISPSMTAFNGFGAAESVATQQRQHSSPPKLGLGGRQTSLVGSGTKVLSNLISGSSSDSQRRDSNANNPLSCYEKVSGDVSIRHKLWLEAISHEFDQKLTAFSVNIAVTSDDREYVVGLNDCSMDFVGISAQQDEDKRSFVELIISHMNKVLPKHGQIPASPMSANTSSNNNNSLSSATSCGQLINCDLTKQQQFDNNEKTSDSVCTTTKQQSVFGNRSSGGVIGGSFRRQHSSRNSNQRTYGQLSNRSQSVTIDENDGGNRNMLNGKLYKDSFFTRDDSDRIGFLNRKLSDRSNGRDDAINDSNGLDDSTLSIEPNDTTTTTTVGGSSTTMSVSSTQLNQAQAGAPGSTSHSNQSLFGQSLFDSTSTALNSLQRQSLSFFRRLDSRTGQDLNMGSTNTPPQSAKSDRAFQHSVYGLLMGDDEINTPAGRSGGFKSQSIDSPEAPYLRSRPPKPPPPKSSGSLGKTRQTSLAGQHQTRVSGYRPATMTPTSTRQNSLATGRDNSAELVDTNTSQQQRAPNKNQRVTRQNSALSAFEPFDAELARATRQQTLNDPSEGSTQHAASSTMNINDQNKIIEPQPLPLKPLSYDSGSITSADSSSTGDTSGAAASEDTMKNLKKTFASIFGDKQVE